MRSLVPGLALSAVGVGSAFLVHTAVPAVSALTAAVLLGAVLGNTPVPLDVARPGLAFAARRLLRVGIVLLGLRLAVGDVVALGAGGFAVVVGVVVLTFFGTLWLGRRLGLSPGASLLIASGFSICGASAVAAVDGVSRNRKEDVAAALALVTIFGSLAIVVLPVLQHPLGLDDAAYGAWTGASVHDVGQTVAAASAAGPVALAAAIVVKLTRVALLAPLVAGIGVWERRRTREDAGPRPPLVPLFVVGFLAAVLVGSTGALPEAATAAGETVSTVLLAAALFGLGTSVRLAPLLSTGGRALLVGSVAWAAVCALAYAGVVIVTG